MLAYLVSALTDDNKRNLSQLADFLESTNLDDYGVVFTYHRRGMQKIPGGYLLDWSEIPPLTDAAGYRAGPLDCGVWAGMPADEMESRMDYIGRVLIDNSEGGYKPKFMGDQPRIGYHAAIYQFIDNFIWGSSWADVDAGTQASAALRIRFAVKYGAPMIPGQTWRGYETDRVARNWKQLRMQGDPMKFRMPPNGKMILS